jgi:hypothetical protein
MKKGILLTVLVVLLCQLAVIAQNYDRYNYFHEEAVKLKNEGKLVEAKEKFKKIKVICKGGIPEDNDLDKMIRECTTISLSENNLEFESFGGRTKNVTVKVNASTFKASSNSKWCKVGKKGNTISVSCENNDTPNPRNAIVSVMADGRIVSFGVYQLGGELDFEAIPDSVFFTKMCDTVEISIFTNADSWRVDSIPDWIEYQSSDSVLYLRSMQNNHVESREATLYIAVADDWFPIFVCQAQSDTTITVNKEELVFPSAETRNFLSVGSNFNDWQIVTSNDWILASVNKDTVTVQVQQNESLFSRHGWVKIGSGSRFCKVLVHQYAFTSETPVLKSEISNDGESKGAIMVNSIPNDLKVTIIDDGEESSVRYTPFDLPIDYGHYSLIMGLERREVFANERQQDVLFKPGLRFATITWSPKTTFGMMSGYVGSQSWGAFAHFQANTPLVTTFSGEDQQAGYSMTFGPVYCPNGFPFIGAYAGVGIGGYVAEPHVGLDYEAGIMGFYKHFMLTMGFHTTRISSSMKTTQFMLGMGGYLKRYYDTQLGYCSSDSRRWVSLNYVFRPSENGKGFMVGDMGKDKVRAYLKALYLPTANSSDSLAVRNVEGGLGLIFTPANGLIDMCVGVSGTVNIKGLKDRFQGVGLELGTILNIWRFPLTVFLHESDLFGERHLCVDFGIGFHLGEFGRSKCSYQ